MKSPYTELPKPGFQWKHWAGGGCCFGAQPPTAEEMVLEGQYVYAETKRIRIGRVRIPHQGTQDLRQPPAAASRTIHGMRSPVVQLSGWERRLPLRAPRIRSWMQVFRLRQPSRVKCWAPSERVAGGSSAHTIR